MKTAFVLFIVSLLSQESFVLAQSSAQRTTHNGRSVTVIRTNNPAYWDGSGPQSQESSALSQEEADCLKKFTAGGGDTPPTMLISGTKYVWKRNCHDFAWTPYMSTLCNNYGPQCDAYWMVWDPGNQQEWPNANWIDGSMKTNVQSIQLTAQSSQYLFELSDLNGLKARYVQAPSGGMIPLPTCGFRESDDVNAICPEHSALLIGWTQVLAVDRDGNNLVGGLFVSKWGNLGVFQHKWGMGYLPDVLYSPPSLGVLRVFTPTWSPPQGEGYPISYSFW